MSKHCDIRPARPLRNRSAWLAAALLTLPQAGVAHAAARIESFDTGSWQRLQKDLPRPSVVVFSTTDCGHCPGTIAALAAQLQQQAPQQPKVPLVVVVMDGDGQPELLQEPHYRAADRLFVFRGQGTALQYSVHPGWRGMTPYVALLPHEGAVELVLGRPSAQALERWLQPGRQP
ncbi:hypothetical protein [Duganella violaceipulchra]|uniref:Thioredoxin domain-containing protein n=1 Tax=Duganella violaceipulchra TaxID=2849652 RepID=A0AA41HHB4_9BURK|nr:hypothetical protein [Duganella violaceicalia]MBV6324514.1 hypothetical protein [Duganella violaceicalia]MCP2009220.1 hypothetical protein [Duganella violaceicalia]